MKRILVIDGQGGGIGKAVISALRDEFGDKINITAYGTNSAATTAMRRAGADQGATGENAIRLGCARADIIIGSVGIVAAGSMLGEMTAEMARSIAESDAVKLLIPLDRCHLIVAGARGISISAATDDILAILRDIL